MEYYTTIKALHVISMIAWMAGMLYLPRLFVYHCDVETGSETSETFKVMERRLLKAIINPAMIATWIFGLILFVMAELWSEPWMHAKFVLVLAMSAAHGILVKHQRLFAQDANQKPATYFRILNEVPTVLMILIVILVIVKPFYTNLH